MYQLKLSVLCDLTAGDTLHPGSRSKWKLQLDKIAHCHTADAIHVTCSAKSENLAISTFSRVGSLSSNGLRMRVFVYSTGIVQNELIRGDANVVHT